MAEGDEVSWQELAKRIPLWTGCWAMVGGRRRLVEFIGQGMVLYRDKSGVKKPTDIDRLLAAPEVDAFPDLTDPDTARGAIARLALAMGAPAEVVAIGVRFYRPETIETEAGFWRADAGKPVFEEQQWDWCSQSPLAMGITDRPTAIATAWTGHLQENEK